jgi:hypothetical protein
LRSFFVPKTSATISKTISQCQMLNEPMIPILLDPAAALHSCGEKIAVCRRRACVLTLPAEAGDITRK